MADVSKVNSYAVLGGAVAALTVGKFVGYAVTNDADTHASVSKVVAYAVTQASTQITRPQVFVAT
jgi:hypothetical protein